MKESIKNYMKVGIIVFMAYPSIMKGDGEIVSAVKKIAADDYFDAIEVTWIKDHSVRAEVKKILEESKIKVIYGAQPRLLTTGLNINDLNEGGRQEALKSLKEGIDEAEFLGSKSIGFLAGKYKEETKEESYRALLKSTKELCEYAKDRDIKVVLEVFDYDIDKCSLMGPVSMVKRYAEEIRKEYDNFGIMVDLSHIPQLHETIEESILPIKDYIVHAHMGNCVVERPGMQAYGDQHPRFGFPNSEVDVKELVEYLRLLKDIGYINKENPPIISFEVKPWGDEDPEMVIANSKRTLNEAWTLV